MNGPTLLELEDRRVLVFGMTWEALVAENVSKAARAVAVSRKATHYAHGPDANFVGTAYLPTAQTKPRGIQGLRDRLKGQGRTKNARAPKLYSAAFVLTRAYPSGRHVFAFEIEEGLYWTAGIASGEVLEASEHLTRDIAVAVKRIEELSAGTTGGTRAAEVHSSLKVDGVVNEDLQSLLLQIKQHLNPALELEAVQAKASSSRSRFLLYSGAAVVVVGMLKYKQVQDEADLAAATANRPVVNVNDLWKQAAETWAKGQKIDSEATRTALFSSLLQGTKVELGGWELRKVMCDAAVPGWECAATYRRTPRSGTSAQFYDQQPRHWTTSWTSVEEVLARWTITAERRALSDFQLPTARAFEITGASEIQRVRAAFTDVEISKTTPAPVAAPLLPDGSGIAPQPANYAAPYSVRDVRLHGPLRSLATIPWHLMPMTIERFEIVVQPSASPSLTTSALQVELQGKIYGKN